jgi:hypothetical protein
MSRAWEAQVNSMLLDFLGDHATLLSEAVSSAGHA